MSKTDSVKIALYCNYASQFLSRSLKTNLKEFRIPFELYQADYNQADMEFYDQNSELFTLKPDFIILHETAENIVDLFYANSLEERNCFAQAFIERIGSFLDVLSASLPSAKLIYPVWESAKDMVYGNYYSKVEHSWDYQQSKFSWELLQQNKERKNLLFIDTNRITADVEDPKNYSLAISADLHFSIGFLNKLSNEIAKMIQGFRGGTKKCIILDLDNTLWGGVIGDDGMENIEIGELGMGKAFTKFQKWLKELKNRGIILAICSKNNLPAAQEPFEKHPDMVLRLEDIAVFVANWENKADNIRHIQSILNIGFDSMVFLDDNPAERKIVEDNIPGITVPDLPEDAAYYLPFLKQLNLFETTSVSSNDKDRTKQYQEEAKRSTFSRSITNIEQYLQSLEMVAIVGPFKKDDFSRIAQLTQRSNQFNLRTIRYTDGDIEKMSHNKEYLTFSVKLSDRFGDYGLISLVILKIEDNDAFIDTWLMSCRVLKRGVEQMVLNQIVDQLSKKGIDLLSGEYIPSSKNSMVENHYKNLGFLSNGNLWQLNVWEYNQRQSFIKLAENDKRG